MKLNVISDTAVFSDSHTVEVFHSVARELNAVQIPINRFYGVRYTSNNRLLEPIHQKEISLHELELKKNIGSFFRDIKNTKNAINTGELIHVRGPSPALFYALILSFFYPKKKFWFKYANVWNESGRSIFWDIQKWLLKRNRNIKVTVNGNWPDLPKHIIPFENPCFYEKNLEESKSVEKIWPTKKKAVFVGRITAEKGVFRILEGINSNNAAYLSELIFVGEGRDMDRLLQELSNHPYKELIKVLGPASKDKVLEILEESHLLLLPTTSPEGFPKVISEAWLKSCLPVTSDISSIPQYVKDGKTGFVWKRKTDDWGRIFMEALKLEESQFKEMKKEIEQILPLFTYEYFAKRIKKEILNIKCVE